MAKQLQEEMDQQERDNLVKKPSENQDIEITDPDEWQCKKCTLRNRYFPLSHIQY